MQRLLTGPDFNFEAVIHSHGWVQMPPFHYDGQRLTRVHQLPDGRIIRIIVQPTGNTSRESFLLVDAEGPVFPTDSAEIATAVERILALRWDMAAFYDLLRAEGGYDWVMEARAGRLLRAPTVWEDMVKTLLTTNTTWMQTKAMVNRLMTLGDESPFGHAFPRPEQIAALDVETLTAHVKAGYRGVYLHAFAQQAADLNIERWISDEIDSETLYKNITALKGFGDYAAASILRLLNHHDRLSIDTVARAAFAQWHNNGETPTDAQLHAHYDRYGAWRGLVLWMDVLREG